MIEHHKLNQKEITLTYVDRPYWVDIREMFDDEGHWEGSINPSEVDSLVYNLAGCIQGWRTDTVVAAIGIIFMLVMWRFQLNLSGYVGFITNFLRADDPKLGIPGFMRLLDTHYQDKVKLNKRVPLPKEVTVKL